MKTKQLIILALLLSVYILSAQTEKKPTTVRMKTKLVKNGVTTIKDTTFETTDPSKVIVIPANDKRSTSLSIEQTDKQKMNELGIQEITILSDESSDPAELKNSRPVTLHLNIDSLIKENGLESPPKEGEQYIIKKVKCNGTNEESGDQKEVIMITIHKRIDITEANDDEISRLNKQTGVSYHKLTLDKLNFYPNPNNGKFNLSFSTTKKEDTEITIQSIEGKIVYQEKLPAFSGSYDKEMDISQHPKGAYFIKIVRGNEAEIRKIVIE